ncbi:MAG: CbtA family protein [Dermatophilaceae bacterium]
MTYGALLKRYMLAGLAAGVVCALWLWIVGEPVIREGLKFEDWYDAQNASKIGPQGPELFNRATQVIGGMCAIVFVALVVSFLFGTLYAFLRHRFVGGRGDVKTSAALAGVAFLLTVLVPWFRYPFLPPGMGDGATVAKRSAWDLALIATSIVAFVIVELLVARLKGRLSDDTYWLLAIVAPIVVIGAIMYVFPSVGDPYPYGISAPMIWSFRLRSLGNFALFWSIIGILGGWMVNRVATTSSLRQGLGKVDRDVTA